MSESREEWFRFLRYFIRLEPTDGLTVRLFERVDRNRKADNEDELRYEYFAYGEDAQWIANNTMGGNLALKSTEVNGKKVFYCKVLPLAIREAAQVRKLDIYSRPNGGEWRITRSSTPGNREAVDEIAPAVSTSTVKEQVAMSVKLSVKAQERIVGVSYVNVETLEIGASEFSDDEYYTNLRAMAIQLGASEMIIPAIGEGDKKNPELEKIKSIMMDGDDNLGILVTEIKSAGDFNPSDIEEDLSNLLVESDVSVKALPQFELQRAMGAASALIKYLGLLKNTGFDVSHKFTLTSLDLSQYMRLDSSALRALNLMPSVRDGSKTMSLYGLLNHCKTAGGQRLLSRWLRQPLMSLKDINHRQDLVETFVNNNSLRLSLQDTHLHVVPDLSKLNKKLQKNNTRDTLEDLIRIYQLIIELPNLIESLTDVSDLITKTYTEGLIQCYENLASYQSLVEETIDLAALERHEFRIKAEFDEELQRLRLELDALESNIREAYDTATIELSIDADKLKLERHHIYGWCFRLTRANAGILKGKTQYILCANGGMSKAGQFFRTKDVAKHDAEYRKLEEKFKRIQSVLVKKIISIAATYHTVLEDLSVILSNLDVIVSFAHVAAYSLAPYSRPKMYEAGTGDVILKEARHPCMEVQEGIEFIANDVNMVNGESDFLIITGPNMGGKSTYIRQIGVISLMAQVGAYVPCTEAELPIFDSILSRIGAGDSQLKGVSTFMAEMLETATILKSATKNSLIVIDELGRGTSTYDGFGLAWAISEHIVEKIGCKAMFATHFHELTALADSHKSVCNLHVLAHVSDVDGASSGDDKEIILQYKIEPGFSDQSFGIHVAKMVNFPEKVLNMAKRKALELEDFEGDDEEAVSKKVHKKFSNEDIHGGNRILKEIFDAWQKSVDDANDSPETLIRKLQETANQGIFAEKLATNGYLQELMSVL